MHAWPRRRRPKGWRGRGLSVRTVACGWHHHRLLPLLLVLLLLVLLVLVLGVRPFHR